MTAIRAMLVEEASLVGRRLTNDRQVGAITWVKASEEGCGVRVLEGNDAAVSKYFVPLAHLPEAAAGDVVTFRVAEDGLADIIRVGHVNRPSIVAQLQELIPEGLNITVDGQNSITVRASTLPASIGVSDFISFDLDRGVATGIEVVAMGAPDTVPGECPICLEPKQVANACEAHSLCLECFQGCLLADMNDQSKYPLSCPAFGCTALVDIAGTARQILTQTDLQTIEQLTLADALGGGLVARCTECNSVQYCGRARANCSGTCVKCRAFFCARCGACDRSHRSQSCESYQATLRSASQDVAENAARGMGYRSCPGCSAMIERDGGCNHMTHRKCPQPTNPAREYTEFCNCCGVLLRDSSHTMDGVLHFPNGVFHPCVAA